MFPSRDFITIHILESQRQHLAVTWNSFVLASIYGFLAFLHGSLICRCEKQLFVREAGVILTHYLRQMWRTVRCITLRFKCGAMFHAIRLSLTFAGNDKLPFDFLCLSPAGLTTSLCLNNSLPSCEGNRDFQNAYLLAEMSFCSAETLPKVVVVVVKKKLLRFYF